MGIKFSNNASTTLAGALNNTATSLSVFAGDGVKFPILGASDYFWATLVKLVSGTPVLEIVKVTAHSAGSPDSFTIVRGQDGTTATTFAAGDKIEIRFTAQAATDIIEAQKSKTVAITANTSTTALDLSTIASGYDVYLVTVAANTTITFTNPPAGVFNFTVHLINDATAGRTVAFAASPTVVFEDAQVPPRTTAANATDIYGFYSVSGGAPYIGSLTYKNIG